MHNMSEKLAHHSIFLESNQEDNIHCYHGPQKPDFFSLGSNSNQTFLTFSSVLSFYAAKEKRPLIFDTAFTAPTFGIYIG